MDSRVGRPTDCCRIPTAKAASRCRWDLLRWSILPIHTTRKLSIVFSTRSVLVGWLSSPRRRPRYPAGSLLPRKPRLPPRKRNRFGPLRLDSDGWAWLPAVPRGDNIVAPHVERCSLPRLATRWMAMTRDSLRWNSWLRRSVEVPRPSTQGQSLRILQVVSSPTTSGPCVHVADLARLIHDFKS